VFEPTTIQLINRIGYFLRKQGEYEAAERVFRALERFQPEFVYPVLGRALTYAVQGKNSQAVPAFEQVLVRRPTHSFALACLGVARLQNKQGNWRAPLEKAALIDDEHGGQAIARELLQWWDEVKTQPPVPRAGATSDRLKQIT